METKFNMKNLIFIGMILIVFSLAYADFGQSAGILDFGNMTIGENKTLSYFLINTGKSGKTEPLVKYFLESCKDPEYLKRVKEEFIPLNNDSISLLIKGEIKKFYKALTKLSHFQFENLQPMIPSPFRKIWKKGLETGDYILKLCGSGGGGSGPTVPSG